ncbi:MAG: hypothetical protein ABI853_07175 [Sphingomicrobium sp.]
MNKTFLPIVLSASLLSGCATDSYGNSNVSNRAMIGVLAGGALGALAGSAAGINPVTGAAAGMVVGGAAGVLVGGPVVHHRQYYRDSRGYCYYVNSAGKPTYDPAVAC